MKLQNKNITLNTHTHKKLINQSYLFARNWPCVACPLSDYFLFLMYVFYFIFIFGPRKLWQHSNKYSGFSGSMEPQPLFFVLSML